MDDPTWGLANQKGVDAEIQGLAREVAANLRAGKTTGPEADDLTNRIRAARAAFAKASADELIRLLSELFS